MISEWSRFVPESRYYDLVLKNGWFEHLADGSPTNGLPYDRAGSDIDTSNPQAARWYWDNIIHNGFDSLWADETEPDLPPNGSYFSIGRAHSISMSIRCSTPRPCTTDSAAMRIIVR